MSKAPSQKLKTPLRAAMLAVLPLVAALPAFAQTTSPVAPTPVTPAAFTPSTTQVTSGAACAAQLDDHGVALDQTSQGFANDTLIADGLGLAAEALASVIPLVGSALSAVG